MIAPMKSGLLALALLSSPVVAQAGVILGFGTQENHVNSLAQYIDTTSFPAIDTMFLQDGPSLSEVNYSYTQSGGTATFAWDVVQIQGANPFSVVSHVATQKFTPQSDANYTWTNNWTGLLGSSVPSYFASLYDLTASQYLFDDSAVNNHAGALLVNHQYQFSVTEKLSEGGSGFGATGFGDFNFTVTDASAVPEPGSLTVVGLGMFSIALAALRRRWTASA